MYISSSKHTKNGKTYTTHMLRHSYRQDGKVKHKNIGCLNLCSEAELEAIKFALKHKLSVHNLTDKNEIKIKQGKSFGGAWATYSIAKSLKIDRALGKDKNGKIALLQVLARVLGQGFKLKSVRMQDSYAFREILGLKQTVSDDSIYRNLDWLSGVQQKVEKKLWEYNAGCTKNQLFLYDVTSSYLEGEGNEYGAYGYNRDGKKGKKQIVIGLMTNSDGMPLKISVFDGNTNDTKTFGDQVKASAEQFGVSNVVFVGDRGMIKAPQIKELAKDCSYITAIGRKEISTLINKKLVQLDLFESILNEVVDSGTGVRYIMRCNPVRWDEIRAARNGKLRKILELVQTKNDYLQSSPKSKVTTAHKVIAEKIRQYKIGDLLKLEEVKEGEREIKVRIQRDGLKKARELDGCYVIKSNVSQDVTKETIHARYKDLKLVEDAFRTMKQCHLELRPVYVRKKTRTAAHVFIVMLAYMIIREMRRLLSASGKEVLTEEILKSLDLICLQEFSEARATNRIYRLPLPSDINCSYLERLKINLPEVFISGMTVATKTRDKAA